MSMPIPKRLKVGTVTYKVILGSAEGLGHVDFTDKTVHFNTRYHQDFIPGTLMHEIIEIINRQYTVDLEHYQTSTLAEALLNVLSENGMLRTR